MMLLTMCRYSEVQKTEDVLHFLFNSINELNAFITNTYEHTMQSFSQSFISEYKIDIGIMYYRFMIEDFDVSKITDGIPMFHTTDINNELKENWDICNVDEIWYMIDKNLLAIPIELAQIFDRITIRTKELNNAV